MLSSLTFGYCHYLLHISTQHKPLRTTHYISSNKYLRSIESEQFFFFLSPALTIATPLQTKHTLHREIDASNAHRAYLIASKFISPPGRGCGGARKLIIYGNPRGKKLEKSFVIYNPASLCNRDTLAREIIARAKIFPF